MRGRERVCLVLNVMMFSAKRFSNLVFLAWLFVFHCPWISFCSYVAANSAILFFVGKILNFPFTNRKQTKSKIQIQNLKKEQSHSLSFLNNNHSHFIAFTLIYDKIYFGIHQFLDFQRILDTILILFLLNSSPI